MGGAAMQAMILAAGRGERMRPLSDNLPKPLLDVDGKSLLAWQIERLVAAGFRDQVINVAYRGQAIEDVIGDGARFGARIRYSREAQPLEVAGGIATALPLLNDDVALVISGDLYTEYDYASLRARLEAMRAASGPPHAHMVMVANPPYHPRGDFALQGRHLALDEGPRSTFGNIALYRTSLFAELPRGTRLKILPYYRDWIAQGWVTGERFEGRWANVGTPADLAELDRALRTEHSEKFTP
jgi:N-acetyl-alpha-D-muramate 1-phosphate uridylyltransferase